jgi:pyruvate dehydrogenase E2 component (dihydrolipoamide acetyltransferase)
VRRGGVVAVVETAKGAIAIEIFEDGTVASLIAAPGETLKVGAPMAEIATATQEPAPPSPAEAPAQPPPPPLPGRRVTTMERPEGTAPMRVRTTPAARRRAATLGIPLERLRGTGVDGAICLADLAEAKPHGSGFDPASMRAAIAAAMGRAKREIPHYCLSETIDLGEALDHLAALNGPRDPPARILPAALLLRAAARADRVASCAAGNLVGLAEEPMTEAETRAMVAALLGAIAPEADLAAVAEDADLRETLDLDSMDFMRFVAGLHERTGLPIPEADYPRLFTLRGIVAYFA